MPPVAARPTPEAETDTQAEALPLETAERAAHLPPPQATVGRGAEPTSTPSANPARPRNLAPYPRRPAEAERLTIISISRLSRMSNRGPRPSAVAVDEEMNVVIILTANVMTTAGEVLVPAEIALPLAAVDRPGVVAITPRARVPASDRIQMTCFTWAEEGAEVGGGGRRSAVTVRGVLVGGGGLFTRICLIHSGIILPAVEMAVEVAAGVHTRTRRIFPSWRLTGADGTGEVVGMLLSALATITAVSMGMEVAIAIMSVSVGWSGCTRPPRGPGLHTLIGDILQPPVEAVPWATMTRLVFVFFCRAIVQARENLLSPLIYT